LGVGEALISFLDEKGIPAPVERAKVLPPQAQIGPITPDERLQTIRSSMIAGVYEKEIDRESAFEILQSRINKEHEKVKAEEEREREEKESKQAEKDRAAEERRKKREGGGIWGDITKYVGRSVTSTIGREIGRTLIRGLLGGLTKRR